MSTLTEFRAAKDAFFQSDPQSPLEPGQRRTFAGLHYFPENPALRFELELEPAAQPERVVMATSTGDEQEYFHAGQVTFPIGAETAVLQVYITAAGTDYFVPFVDRTAPAESYGAGRYLEPEDLGGGRLRLDFNLAYNPYCAYNDRWSCPIPPAANRLAVRIEAGEKKFHD